ncbi:MAG TPA: hypothetical protein VLM20_05745, partial [Methylophilaceae bacterium]|nr:hypothetical protein [Methylophilaceae bacterium]
MVLVFLLAIVVLGYSVFRLDAESLQNKKNIITADVLAEAKAALIGYAAGVNLEISGKRPGDLPCPD